MYTCTSNIWEDRAIGYSIRNNSNDTYLGLGFKPQESMYLDLTEGFINCQGSIWLAKFNFKDRNSLFDGGWYHNGPSIVQYRTYLLGRFLNVQ